MQALLALGVLGILSVSATVSRRPPGNPYLHLPGVGALGIEVRAASVPIVGHCLATRFRAERWSVVIAGGLMSWGLAEAISPFVGHESARRYGR
jgi:hypothetical protein